MTTTLPPRRTGVRTVLPALAGAPLLRHIIALHAVLAAVSRGQLVLGDLILAVPVVARR